jgi:cytochrome c551/c552
MKLASTIATAILVSLITVGKVCAGPAEDIIARDKCNKCHTATSTKKGPSWASVAEKYRGKPDPTPQLVEMLKTGGKDDHNKIDAGDADLRAVIAIVLSSK